MALPERWRIIPGSDKALAFANGASSPSAAVGSATFAVLLSTTQNAHIAVGTAPAATATNWLLKSTDPGLIIGVSPGEKIAAYGDSAAGILYIAELTS